MTKVQKKKGQSIKEEGYLVIYELNGELSGKYKFNKDKTTLTSIGGKEVYFKRD